MALVICSVNELIDPGCHLNQASMAQMSPKAMRKKAMARARHSETRVVSVVVMAVSISAGTVCLCMVPFPFFLQQGTQSPDAVHSPCSLHPERNRVKEQVLLHILSLLSNYIYVRQNVT